MVFSCLCGERQCGEEGFSDKGRLLMVGNSAALPSGREGLHILIDNWLEFYETSHSEDLSAICFHLWPHMEYIWALKYCEKRVKETEVLECNGLLSTGWYLGGRGLKVDTSEEGLHPLHLNVCPATFKAFLWSERTNAARPKKSQSLRRVSESFQRKMLQNCSNFSEYRKKCWDLMTVVFVTSDMARARADTHQILLLHTWFAPRAPRSFIFW